MSSLVDKIPTSVDISIGTAGGHDYPIPKTKAPPELPSRYDSFRGAGKGNVATTLTPMIPLGQTPGPDRNRHQPRCSQIPAVFLTIGIVEDR